MSAGLRTPDGAAAHHRRLPDAEHTKGGDTVIVALKVLAILLLWLAGVVTVCWWMERR